MSIIQPPADGFYTTDAFVDNALQFLDAGDKSKPFFLYLAFNAPHFPLMAPADEIAKFRGKYKIGWDKLREQRHARQIELGIVDKAWPLSPRPPEVKAWDTLTPEEQDRFDHLMAIYAAVVAHMDAAVGRFVEALAPARRARQHADPLPLGQRRQCRGRSGRPIRRAAARLGRLERLLRPILGDAREHPLPPLQAFQPRGRHLDPAHRALAGADFGRRPAPHPARASD